MSSKMSHKHRGELQSENGIPVVKSIDGHRDSLGEMSCEHLYEYLESDWADQEYINFFQWRAHVE